MRKMTFIASIILIIVAFSISFFVGCDHPTQGEQTIVESLDKKGGIPSDGNGKKDVVELDEEWIVVCDGYEIFGHMKGWFQFKEFGGENNKNIDITIYHLVFTYTNADGDKFVWHDVGPDHWYMDGEHLIVSMTGRSTGSGVIGHVVFNVSTWEFEHIAGNEFGNIDDLACEKLQ